MGNQTYIASRLSEDNKVFPTEIHIEPNGLTVKTQKLFGGESRHIDFNQIGEVSIDAPMIGFSTITFYTAGTKVSAHGFTSNEVKEIRAAIENGKSKGRASTIKNNSAKQKDSKEEDATPIGHSLDDVLNLNYTNDLQDTKNKLDAISVKLTGRKWDINGDGSKIVAENNRILNQCLQQYKVGLMRLKSLTSDAEVVKYYEKEFSKLRLRKILTKYWAILSLLGLILLLIILAIVAKVK